jgi:hypothetical protein
MNELTTACCDFYNKQINKKNSNEILSRRANLAQYAESFHRKCGTLTPLIKERIAALTEADSILLMTAHQPNLFPYSGVLRKSTLLFVLAKRLEAKLKVPVVSFYGIADHDFSDDRWVRSFQLPASARKDGVLEIKMDLPNKMMLYKVPKPSFGTIQRMQAEIQKWFDDSIISVRNLLGEKSPSFCMPAEMVSNLKEFWDLVVECYRLSGSYAEFNSFLGSKIVNDSWGYDTIFARLSDCLPTFNDETVFFLKQFDEYSKALREAINEYDVEGVNGGVSSSEPEFAPFWYHCDCGSKARMSMEHKGEALFSEGSCLGCGRTYHLEFNVADPSLSNDAPRIFPRSIPMILTFFKGLLPSCYVGGVGGITYLKEAQHVARSLGIPLPPLTVWRPHDRYLGIAQMEALLQFRRMLDYLGTQDFSSTKSSLESRISENRKKFEELQESKRKIFKELEKDPANIALKEQLKMIYSSQMNENKASNFHVISRDLVILTNIPNTLRLVPSILDYVVNVGSKETSEQWIQFLMGVGDLSSDLSLKSILSREAELNNSWLSDTVDHLNELRSNLSK